MARDRGASERIAARAFVDHTLRRIGTGDLRWPGTHSYFAGKEDGAEVEVELLMMTRSELADWFRSLKPELGTIDVTNSVPNEWIAVCDEHSVIARGEMTALGHDEVVVAWYEHDKAEHGGDGRVPAGDLIGPRCPSSHREGS